MPSQYRWDSRDDPYDASMRNLRKAWEAGARVGGLRGPRPWRSEQEARAIRRAVWLWCTSEGPTWSGREIGLQLRVSHTHVQKLVRQFAADPVKAMRGALRSGP